MDSGVEAAAGQEDTGGKVEELIAAFAAIGARLEGVRRRRSTARARRRRRPRISSGASA